MDYDYNHGMKLTPRHGFPTPCLIELVLLKIGWTLPKKFLIHPLLQSINKTH